MLTKILWITAILSLMLHATTERTRTTHGKKEYIRCFDGQLSFIKKRDHLFYSSLHHRFSNKEDASKDSCKKQHIATNAHAVVCTNKDDIVKTIKNMQKNKQLLYPTCFALQEELNLLVSAHAYYRKQLSYFHIKYQGRDLFIPKASVNLTSVDASKYAKTSNLPSNVAKKHYKKSKYKNHKKNKYSHVTKKHTKAKHKKAKRTKVKYAKAKHTRAMHTKTKYTTAEHTKAKSNHSTYSNSYYTNSYTTPKSRTTQKHINTTRKSHTYKCLGSHGDVNIFATDDTSISMASDILWRMCQKLKKGDEVCTIRDCYKLIR